MDDPSDIRLLSAYVFEILFGCQGSISFYWETGKSSRLIWTCFFVDHGPRSDLVFVAEKSNVVEILSCGLTLFDVRRFLNGHRAGPETADRFYYQLFCG